MIFGYEKKEWPLCILTAEGKPSSEEEFRNLLNGWSELYTQSKETGQKFKFLIDVRGVNGVDLKYMVMMGKFLLNSKELTEEWMDRTAVLVSNKNIKMLIKFVFTLYKPVRPFKVFNEAEKSLQWLVNDEKGDSESDV